MTGKHYALYILEDLGCLEGKCSSYIFCISCYTNVYISKLYFRLI